MKAVYLDVADHVRLDGLEGSGAEDIWQVAVLATYLGFRKYISLSTHRKE